MHKLLLAAFAAAMTIGFMGVAGAAFYSEPMEWDLAGSDGGFPAAPDLTFHVAAEPCGTATITHVTEGWDRDVDVCIEGLGAAITITGDGVSLEGEVHDRTVWLCHGFGGVVHQEAYEVHVSGTVADDGGIDRDVWLSGIAHEEPVIACYQ